MLCSSTTHLEEKVWSCQLFPFPGTLWAAGAGGSWGRLLPWGREAGHGCAPQGRIISKLCHQGTLEYQLKHQFSLSFQRLGSSASSLPLVMLSISPRCSPWKRRIFQGLPGCVYQLAYYSTILFFRCITSLASYDLKSTQKINKGILFSGKDAESSSALAVS